MPSIITRGGMSAKALGFGASTSESAVYVEDVFSTYLYTGTGSNRTITNNIDLSTKGGLVWTKFRNGSLGVGANALYDTVRGPNLYISSNQTGGNFTTTDQVTAFNINGYNLGADATHGQVNYAAQDYVSWTFRKQPKFFTICTWTGDAVAGRQISHDLGSTPGMIIVKCTSTATGWSVYHQSLTATQRLFLNTTDAAVTQANVWNNTTPTATNFTVGTNLAVNGNGQTYVAYLFADQAGGFGAAGADSVVACGSLSASSSTTVTLGWEPQYVLLKQSSGAQNWYCVDVMRGMSYRNFVFLQPNVTDAESDAGTVIQPTATGFVFKGTNLGATSGETYIYLAIRRGPMKTPTGATNVFNPSFSVGGFPSYVTTFPVDFSINGDTVATDKFYAASRLTTTGWLQTTATTAEGSASSFKWDSNTGCIQGWPSTYIGWNFGRAPGFFDVVCYSGLGTSQNYQNHNLKVAPELIIWKSRSNVTNWAVWCKYTGSSSNTNFAVYLNSNAGSTDQGFQLTNVTLPTSTVFTMWDNAYNNASGYTYVAYLFATCAGVSKVGSYSGTGAAQNIDCGFSAGARFVLIKRTDSTGDWYTYDSARGISASTDPYLLLNSTAAEVTGTDYVNTYSTGFSLTASAPSGLNANGGSYIFLAIA